MTYVKNQTIEFASGGRRYLLVYLGEHPFDGLPPCEQCDIALRGEVLPHVHVLGELPVPRYDDPGANGASYGDYLHWLAAEHVVVGGKRLAQVSRAKADKVIGEFRNVELQRRSAEMRERRGG